MLISLCLTAIITAGGFSLTYTFSNKETLLRRIAGGMVTGTAIFGTAGFLTASLIGFGTASGLAALGFTLLPLLLFFNRSIRSEAFHDWVKAKGRMQGANLNKALGFIYYLFFLLLFIAFFDRAMVITDQGIFTGGSNNFGDLPFHLGAIYSFIESANFPPTNPNFSGTTFSYPYISDLTTAFFVQLGAGIREAIFVQGVTWAFALLVILEGFYQKVLGERFAARIAPFLLFFSGGLGFVWFFSDYFAMERGFFDLLRHLPVDYTIGDKFRWGNSMTTLFLTQRGMLLGMPITILALGKLWQIFNASQISLHSPVTSKASLGHDSPVKAPPAVHDSLLTNIWRDIQANMHEISGICVIGFLAGSLVMIHIHSLAVLFVVAVFLLALIRGKTALLQMMIFGLCVSLIALPELIWSSSGSASKPSSFIGWHFGWDSGESNVFLFWIKNTGLLFPLLIGGIYILLKGFWNGEAQMASAKPDGRFTKQKRKKSHAARHSNVAVDIGNIEGKESSAINFSRPLLFFYVPFIVLFVISNVVKLAPWQWDNIKILIYWFIGTLPFVAIALSWLWRQGGWISAAAFLLFLSMTLSGGLDVWRTVSRQINYQVFDADAVKLAERVRTAIPRDALFLNAPKHNTAVVLFGRPSFMRYPGHLVSHGIEYREREEIVKNIYRGGEKAEELITNYGIDYVLVSPAERNSVSPNEDFFKQFPLVIEVGQYKVYKMTQ